MANHASRVGPADACVEIASTRRGSPWLLLPCCPRRDVGAAPLAPGRPREVGKYWIARPRLMLCLWKQRGPATPTFEPGEIQEHSWRRTAWGDHCEPPSAPSEAAVKLDKRAEPARVNKGHLT